MTATYDDAFAETGRNLGRENTDRAWLLHDCDVWIANPFYVGDPVPHPEDDGAWSNIATDLIADMKGHTFDADDDEMQAAHDVYYAADDALLISREISRALPHGPAKRAAQLADDALRLEAERLLRDLNTLAFSRR